RTSPGKVEYWGPEPRGELERTTNAHDPSCAGLRTERRYEPRRSPTPRCWAAGPDPRMCAYSDPGHALPAAGHRKSCVPDTFKATPHRPRPDIMSAKDVGSSKGSVPRGVLSVTSIASRCAARSIRSPSSRPPFSPEPQSSEAAYTPVGTTTERV